MHPALSVILFTVTSGACFGMLALLGLGAALQPHAPTPAAVIAEFAIAFALTVFGLLSSTFHLGRPERAWRAFSQWRSSWLSREGVLSVATFAPALVLAWGWIIEGRADGIYALAALTTVILAAATVFCTAMIYASLKPIRAWCNAW